jgi:hypothetical protein
MTRASIVLSLALTATFITDGAEAAEGSGGTIAFERHGNGAGQGSNAKCR